MLQHAIVCLALGLLAASDGEAARILAIFPFTGKSHFISFSPLLEELAKRGHQMTVVSAFPRKPSLANYRDVVIDNYLEDNASPGINFFEEGQANIPLLFLFMRPLVINGCEKFLLNPGVQKLIHSTDEKFDLVIYEPFFSECSYGFLHKYDAPTIQISSNTISIWMGDGVGNPFTFSYIPDLMLGYTDRMSFMERLQNSLVQTYLILERNWYGLPKMDALMRKYFNDTTLPSIPELEKKTSFLLLNSHSSLSYPRPLTPNTVEVGGMHVKEPQKLPQDLQKLLDEAKDGVIYFSMGSNLRSAEMPPAMRQGILNAFSKLKQKVLWKWEEDVLPGQPKNVHLSKWFPQNDVLAHPNVKAFITHGGLLSTQEATYFGVPLIAIPIFADQKSNAKKAENQGYAIALDVTKITEKALDEALDKILNKPYYRENARRLSKLFQDQPQKPLERAVFWVEFVLRHKGAPHLHSAALDLKFVQYFLLDVIAVLLLAASVFVALSMFLCRTIYRRLFSKSSKSKINKGEMRKKKVK